MPKVDLYFLFDVGVVAYLDVPCSMFDVYLFPPLFRGSNGLGNFLSAYLKASPYFA